MKRIIAIFIVAYVFYIFPGIDLSLFFIKQKNNLDSIELYDGIAINPFSPIFSVEIRTKKGESIILKDMFYFLGQMRFKKSDSDFSKGGILLNFKDTSFETHIASENGKILFKQGIPISILSAILQEEILSVNDFLRAYDKIECMILSLPLETEIPFEIHRKEKDVVFSITVHNVHTIDFSQLSLIRDIVIYNDV